MSATKLTKNTRDGDLKHYDVYIERLENFAKSININIVRGYEPGDGCWIPSKSRIRLDKDLSESDEVATFLHELGHCLDDVLFSGGEHSLAVHKAYLCIYTDKYTKKQLSLVLDAERRAWKYGRNLAKRLNIRLGKWYDTAVKDSIKAYKGI